MIMNFISWIFNKFNIFRIPGRLVKRDGLIPDESDERDYVVQLSPTEGESYSITDNPYKYVKNQGSWNSCASHAYCTALELYHDVHETNRRVQLSERFHYFFARLDMGNFPGNEGMYARTMMKIGADKGVCPEKLCQYLDYEMNDEPSYFTNSFAKLFRIRAYYRIYDIETFKEIIKNNHPVLGGFLINNSFFRNSGDIVVVDNEQIYGGHEVVIYGFDDNTQELLCINSWGDGYKDRGIMRVPYEYYDEYGIDMWAFSV